MMYPCICHGRWPADRFDRFLDIYRLWRLYGAPRLLSLKMAWWFSK
ncbi:MAG: hypothetical protein KDE14_01725 [Rhodobacteraceae bacterium]|nr:hypothetical protein [Paracoccaceae bacterium]